MSENSEGTAPRLIQNAMEGKGFNGQPERIATDEDGNITIDNPGARWHLVTLKSAIKLEGLGMRHSSGRSALKHAKDVYGLKGNRAAVLAQIDALLEQLRQAEIAQPF